MKNMCHHIFSVLWDNRTNADVSSVVAIFPGKYFLEKYCRKGKISRGVMMMIIMLIIKCTFRATEEANEAHFINSSFYRVGHKKKCQHNESPSF